MAYYWILHSIGYGILSERINTKINDNMLRSSQVDKLWITI